MSQIDYLDVDGRLLRMFLLVYEEGSITKAAQRLEISQSGVSHGLDKLRKLVGDPLFVRSGRGITPTHVADAMVENVRQLLSDLRYLSEQKGLDLKGSSGKFVVAANDLLWGLLLADVFKEMKKLAPNLDLHIVPTGPEVAELLRTEKCDIVLTPIIPDGSEFKQQKLFEDEFMCFYDPDFANAPLSVEDFLSRCYARIGFSNIETNPIDLILAAQGKYRRIALQAPSFSGLPEMMKGTDLIALLPSLFKYSFMQDFSPVPSPVPINPLTFYQIWHCRDDNKPIHKWMRQLIHKLTQIFRL